MYYYRSRKTHRLTTLYEHILLQEMVFLPLFMHPMCMSFATPFRLPVKTLLHLIASVEVLMKESYSHTASSRYKNVWESEERGSGEQNVAAKLRRSRNRRYFTIVDILN